MNINFLVEYINKEERLRGVCLLGDPREVPILKKYRLPEKYINAPLWGISSETMQVIGVLTIESIRTEFSEVGEVLHHGWKLGEFHPINHFLSPFKRPVKAPTISFEYPKSLTVEAFQQIPSFKTFLN